MVLRTSGDITDVRILEPREITAPSTVEFPADDIAFDRMWYIVMFVIASVDISIALAGDRRAQTQVLCG